MPVVHDNADGLCRIHGVFRKGAVAIDRTRYSQADSVIKRRGRKHIDVLNHFLNSRSGLSNCDGRVTRGIVTNIAIQCDHTVLYTYAECVERNTITDTVITQLFRQLLAKLFVRNISFDLHVVADALYMVDLVHFFSDIDFIDQQLCVSVQSDDCIIGRCGNSLPLVLRLKLLCNFLLNLLVVAASTDLPRLRPRRNCKHSGHQN